MDSSLVTAIAAKQVPSLAAFSIGFRDPKFDESPFSQALARRYGLRHYVKYCDDRDFLELVQTWPATVDDPVADPSAAMVYLVSQFARDCGFKVMITGEGSDEFFGGYNQYFRFEMARRLNVVGRYVPFLADLAAARFPHRTRHVHFLRQITQPPAFHGTSMIFEPHLAPEIFNDAIPDMQSAATLRDAVMLDQRQRLADDILGLTDRATMHASIEARVPFVTRYVADFAASLDEKMLINGSVQKYLLKKLAERYVPRQCIYRRKVGFDLPIASWFRGRLRDFVSTPCVQPGSAISCALVQWSGSSIGTCPAGRILPTRFGRSYCSITTYGPCGRLGEGERGRNVGNARHVAWSPGRYPVARRDRRAYPDGDGERTALPACRH